MLSFLHQLYSCKIVFATILLYLSISCYNIPLVTSNYLSQNEFGYHNSMIFNPEGKIVPLEHIRNGINLHGGLVIAIKCKEGILVCTSRRQHPSRLVLNTLSQKACIVNDQLLVTASGLGGAVLSIQDAVEKGSENYEKEYLSKIPLKMLCQQLAAKIHDATLQSRSGISALAAKVLISGYDQYLGYQIYTIEPDGSYHSWKAIAIGKNEQEVVRELTTLMEKKKKKTKKNKLIEGGGKEEEIAHHSTENELEVLLSSLQETILPKYFPDEPKEELEDTKEDKTQQNGLLRQFGTDELKNRSYEVVFAIYFLFFSLVMIHFFLSLQQIHLLSRNLKLNKNIWKKIHFLQ
jgi:20S proteasome alpha/beta subunit